VEFCKCGESVIFIVRHAPFCSGIVVSKVVCGLHTCRTFFIGITLSVFVGLLVGVGCHLYSVWLDLLCVITFMDDDQSSCSYCRAECELSVEFGCGNLPMSSIIISNVVEILAVM
jgi:hypothetical protein